MGLTQVDVLESEGKGEVRLLLFMPGSNAAAWIGDPNEAQELADALAAASKMARSLARNDVVN